MTELSQAMTAKHRQDYRAPLYWIDSIDLDFQLQEPLTRVTAISRLRRSGEHKEPLVLDGEGLNLVSVSVDGVPYQQYEQGESSLTLFNLPAECVLTVVTDLDPAAKGVIVSDIIGGSMAGTFLRSHDIIQSVNGIEIGSVADLRRAVEGGGRQWRIQLRRGDQTVNLSLRG